MMWPILAVAATILGGIAYIWSSSATFEGRIHGLRQAVATAQHRAGLPPSTLPTLMRAYAIRAGGREGGPTMVHAVQRAELVVDPTKPPMQISADQWTGTAVQDWYGGHAAR